MTTGLDFQALHLPAEAVGHVLSSLTGLPDVRSDSFFLLWDRLLGRLSIVFNVAALQNLLFPLLDLVFLLGW